jgi:phage-related tail fiber protein
MALTKIKKSQLDDLNISNADIDVSAAIATSKLADGANFLRRDGSLSFTGVQSFGGFKASNLGAPTADTDVATKLYVDQTAQGLNTKTAVRVATTANITLSGIQTIDGVLLVAGDRVLVKNQTTTTENGTYDASSGAWTRSADSDTGIELVNAFYFVTLGNTLQATGFTQSSPGPITLGTTSIIFNQFSGAADFQAGTGLTKTGLTFDVETASSSRIVVNADNIDLATTGVVAGTYTKVTLDAYGRATTASTATTTDITEGNNLYFNDSRARAAITGGASSIASSNLAVSRALISGTGGKVEVSTVTSTELAHLTGVTSAIQTQLNSKQALDPTLNTIASLTPGPNSLIYFTGADVADTTTITPLGRTIIGSVDTASARTNLGLSIGTDVQAYDPDLGAIATLSGITGFLKKNAANTWSLDTSTYLTSNQNINLSGDVTGSGATGIPVTLVPSGVLAGTYGSATQVPVFAVDAKGRVTGVTNTAINLISSLAGLSDVTITTPLDGQILRYSGGGTNKFVNVTPNFLTANQTINISGDIQAASGTTSLSVVLASVGTAGTYTKVTTDAKGRVTAGQSLTVGDLPGGTINITNIKTREIPSPLPNGAAVNFTAAASALPNTEHVYLNGVLMEPGSGNDYLVISQNPFSIQMLFVPTSSDKLRISYISI